MNRRQIIIAGGLLVAVVELIVSIWWPVPVYLGGFGVVVLLFIFGIVAAWRRNGRPPATFLIDERPPPSVPRCMPTVCSWAWRRCSSW
ncbi:hypothetical protein ACFQX7_24710 [Luedemannella flava]